MARQSSPENRAYEDALLGIVRALPLERVMQILDFARYVQSQAQDDYGLLEDEDEDAVSADEAHWDAQFAATEDGLEKMVEKARTEIRSGLAKRMIFTKNGRIAPR